MSFVLCRWCSACRCRVVLKIDINYTMFIAHCYRRCDVVLTFFDAELKGELNLDKKWQSDYLFYIMMNEIHPRFGCPAEVGALFTTVSSIRVSRVGGLVGLGLP